jgi:hypothetical protein
MLRHFGSRQRLRIYVVSIEQAVVESRSQLLIHETLDLRLVSVTTSKESERRKRIKCSRRHSGAGPNDECNDRCHHDFSSQTAKPLQSITAQWCSTGHNGGLHLVMPLKGGIISLV